MITCRLANQEDAVALMVLYQSSARVIDQDAVLTDLKRLRLALAREDMIWLVAFSDKDVCGFVSAYWDKSQKIARLYLFGHLEDEERSEILKMLLDSLEEECDLRDIDVLYTTTQSLTLKEQARSLQWGYKLVGISPGAVFLDPSRLNGITAKFFGDCLNKGRLSNFAIHPQLEGFYELASQQLQLGALAIGSVETGSIEARHLPVPELEMIAARNFVRTRYLRIRDAHFLTSNFYPFQLPDHMLTDADQQVEIFFRYVPRLKFATLISEHISIAVDPVALYKSIVRQLYDFGVSYIELINEASDIAGTEMILRAGFVPCGYFPGLRLQGKRRDYVIFSRCLERISELDQDLPGPYYQYLRHYHEWETSSLLRAPGQRALKV